MFKFSDNLSSLRWIPHRWGFRSGWHLCQIFGSGWPLVRCTTPGWGFGLGWHLIRYTPTRDILWPNVILLWVRLTFDQTSGQADLWSDVPLLETSCGQVWYYIRSGWPVYWRVSLVPAAMVIPAPLMYIKVVAVKNLIGLLYKRPFTHEVTI